MSRYRLCPSPEQEATLLGHCAHARYVWNLAVEQHAHWRPWRKSAPGYLEQCRQLTAARAEHRWLRDGSQMVQQQALRDFAQAMAGFFAGTHRRPRWRKAGRDEGFRIVAVTPQDFRRLNRNWGKVRVPKVGWVRFRWSRAVPDGVKSYRITRDRNFACNADTNAARNIAAGHAVTARGGDGIARPVNREPQLLPQSA